MKLLSTMILLLLVVNFCINSIKSVANGKMYLVETEDGSINGADADVANFAGDDYSVNCNINDVDAGKNIKDICVQNHNFGDAGDVKCNINSFSAGGNINDVCVQNDFVRRRPPTTTTPPPPAPPSIIQQL